MKVNFADENYPGLLEAPNARVDNSHSKGAYGPHPQIDMLFSLPSIWGMWPLDVDQR